MPKASDDTDDGSTGTTISTNKACSSQQAACEIGGLGPSTSARGDASMAILDSGSTDKTKVEKISPPPGK